MGKNNTKKHTAGATKQPAVTKKLTLPAREPNKILTYKDFGNTGIILMDHKTMQEIKTKSGPLANNCEYQVHYWALVFRARGSDGSILDICIPTVLFNYKQEVSGARIDFELEDVDTMSESLAPVHNMRVNELLATGIQDHIKALLPNSMTIEMMSTNLNTIHRHP